MSVYVLLAFLLLSGSAGSLGATEMMPATGLGKADTVEVRSLAWRAASNQAQITEDLQAAHRKCLEAGDRLRLDVAAMVPGRTWTWELDAEKSRAQLDRLRSDLKAFWDAESAFEARVPSEQRARLTSQFVLIHQLFQHLEGDAQSLDAELRKGYPTRWHVAKDVSDMQREINRWRKFHRRIVGALGLTS